MPKLYDISLIFLYRLLFVLYAESRGLLPVKPYGAGSNKNYHDRYSLQRLIPKIRHEIEYQSDEFTELYEQLLNLFHLINGDQPSRNRACNVPQYNCGLFDHNRYKELEKWRIGEKSLSKVLKDLIFSSGPTMGRGQQEIDFGTIDYADLEVRQLGDIYEGLLGGSLEIRNGRVALNEEYKKRQSTGTFYTPDYIVRYLVEETLSPLIKKLGESESVQNTIKSGKKNNSFANAVLELNILDPAMGSGHFLVRATEWLADRIVEHPTTKFQIESISPGLSQEQAEISYWRRRVVEACIYGVDSNPLAVELAKLSLWLTCIASDEPLNFLDRHFRIGNSLIGAMLDDMTTLPTKKQTSQMPLSFGPDLTKAVSNAIHTIEFIETEASTSLEVVKKKETLWQKEVINKLQPFKTIGDLWTATLSGLNLDEFIYHKLARYYVSPSKTKSKEWKEFKKEWEKIEKELKEINEQTVPFHWELEFPDVFFDKNGNRKENSGFDAILGNPPYISTQSSSGFAYRKGLEFLFNFADDLYVHFVFQGFNLLKRGGMFGFIISDTFFTLGTKQRLRELFQNNRLHRLVQCDPFKATVDAAIFVAEKAHSRENDELFFIQARYKTDKNKPEAELINIIKVMPEFKEGETAFKCNSKEYSVYHSIQGCLRLHRTSIDPYKKALKNAFFEPTDAIVRLYNRFIEPMNRLVDKWWEKIETSKKFAQHKEEILKYHKTLKPGDVTLVGLIAEGGQGLITGDNGRFLAFLDTTLDADKINDRIEKLEEDWNNDNTIKSNYRLLKSEGLSFAEIIDRMKNIYLGEKDWYRVLKLKRGEIYKTITVNEITDIHSLSRNEKENGIKNKIRCWVPYKKGDPEGHKWLDNQQLFIRWDEQSVNLMKSWSKGRWQNPQLYFTAGITWTNVANHASLKARLQPVCIPDQKSLRLTPIHSGISSEAFLSILNSDVFSFFCRKFLNNTSSYNTNDLRMLPIVIPESIQHPELETLAKSAIEAKELTFKKAQPSEGLVDFCQELADRQKYAPEYLRLPKQLKLITTADDCLNISELAVHWAVEGLYGVEGYGPFNEF